MVFLKRKKTQKNNSKLFEKLKHDGVLHCIDKIIQLRNLLPNKFKSILP